MSKLRCCAFLFSLPAHSQQLVCPITYNKEMPEPAVECKFLPCGKTLMDFTTEPVSFPQLETQFNYQFKGLHLLFNIDLINQNAYNPSNDPEKQSMDPKDAALLKDIEALHIDTPKPKVVNNVPTRAQVCRELIAKGALPRPRTGLQTPLESAQLEMKALSLEEQKEIIDQTFVDSEKPIERHPTKMGSKARPLAVMPIFPETELSEYDFVQVHFGIAPSPMNNGIIRDCGNNLINFKAKPESLPENAEVANSLGIQNYISDQRYKEERTAESTERAEHFMLREKGNSYHYQLVHQYMKLRKLRPSPQALASLCLLVWEIQI